MTMATIAPCNALANARLAALLCCGFIGGLTGCGSDAPHATAMLMPATGQVIHGVGTFTESGGTVTLTVTVEQGALGVHGVHIHESKECGPDGKLAGLHWNPDGKIHGSPGSPDSHQGDVGNLIVGPDGKGTLSDPATSTVWTIGNGGKYDVVGHPLVIDELQDDFTLTTNPGARQACGLIVLGK